MLRIADDALVLTALPHGEHGAVVRFLTFQHGLRAGYVPGARGRSRRALIQPGSRVALSLTARSEGQLPSATVESVAARALIMFDTKATATLSWLTLLTSETLSEAMPHPRLAAALDALLAGLDAGISPAEARAATARFELLLLSEEGLGLDLGQCALGGPADDLAFVSPHSGRAVSRAKAAGQPWAGRLLPLPAFLLSGASPTAGDTDAALALTGFFLARHWFDSHPRLAAARADFLGTSRERVGTGAPDV
ncbi:MAG: DNA repair protein RecO [Sphingomonadaceae bacterium]